MVVVDHRVAIWHWYFKVKSGQLNNLCCCDATGELLEDELYGSSKYIAVVDKFGK